MAQQQAIKLKIAGKSYSFTLKHEANEEQSLAEKEELYRLAEREVNAYVTRFEKAKYEGFSTQDCLAMAALQLAISSVSLPTSPFLHIGCGRLLQPAEIFAAEKWAAKISAGWKRCATRSTNT